MTNQGPHKTFVFESRQIPLGATQAFCMFAVMFPWILFSLGSVTVCWLSRVAFHLRHREPRKHTERPGYWITALWSELRFALVPDVQKNCLVHVWFPLPNDLGFFFPTTDFKICADTLQKCTNCTRHHAAFQCMIPVQANECHYEKTREKIFHGKQTEAFWNTFTSKFALNWMFHVQTIWSAQLKICSFPADLFDVAPFCPELTENSFTLLSRLCCIFSGCSKKTREKLCTFALSTEE